jgi:hypothetical protein
MKSCFLVLLIVLASGSYSLAQKTLHLYGGADHDQYLGCLNCSNYDANSIWNSYGKYGNSYNARSGIVMERTVTVTMHCLLSMITGKIHLL